MMFVISFVINLIAVLLVLKYSKNWPFVPLVAGILGFIIYLQRVQAMSGGMSYFAAANDQGFALLRGWYVILMLFWLAVAIRGVRNLFKSKQGRTIGKMLSGEGSSLDRIKKAKELLDSGAIDAAEFEKIKKSALE